MQNFKSYIFVDIKKQYAFNYNYYCAPKGNLRLHVNKIL